MNLLQDLQGLTGMNGLQPSSYQMEHEVAHTCDVNAFGNPVKYGRCTGDFYHLCAKVSDRKAWKVFLPYGSGLMHFVLVEKAWSRKQTGWSHCINSQGAERTGGRAGLANLKGYHQG